MEKILCPRHCITDGSKPKDYDENFRKYYDKLEWLKKNAVSKKYEMWDYVDYEIYEMPDGSVWRRTITNEYMLDYSIEQIA